MDQNKDKYKTVTSGSEGLFKARGSKFIAYLMPCTGPEKFSTILSEVKASHVKARHFCFAYVLNNMRQFRYSDDGEPSGTAGKPIYNQLLRNEIVDAACIVVRYFGGTKLGTSGLINAYKEATKDAIRNNTIQVKYHEVLIAIKFDYSAMGTLLNVLKQLDINISGKNFDLNPVITIGVRKSQASLIIRKIKARLLNRSVEDILQDTEVSEISFSIGEDTILE